jgi:prepilin-type processing-associated H-X9-DG protein
MNKILVVFFNLLFLIGARNVSAFEYSEYFLPFTYGGVTYGDVVVQYLPVIDRTRIWWFNPVSLGGTCPGKLYIENYLMYYGGNIDVHMQELEGNGNFGLNFQKTNASLAVANYSDEGYISQNFNWERYHTSLNVYASDCVTVLEHFEVDSMNSPLPMTYDFLSFPLAGYTPNNAPVTSVFDHSMTASYKDDNKVIAFTGERGESLYGKKLVWGTHFGFKNSQGTPFLANGNYTGGGDTNFLYYDGHPGYDYSTKDLGAAVPVIAAAPGIAYRGDLSLGEIYIDHQNGYQTHYLHLVIDSNLVADNTTVSTGQQLGIAGGTGGFPVHLHFEVRKKDATGKWVPVDPYGWQGCGNDPYTKASNINLWAGVAPVPPSCLSAKPVSPSQIVLGWQDNSTDEIGFKVERILGECRSSSAWKQIVTKAADIRAATNSGLKPNQTYAYQVRSYNGNGDSAYSNCVSAKTGLAATPHSPTNIKAIAKSANQVKLTWTDTTLNATEYKIYRKAGAAPWSLLATIGAATKTYTDNTAIGVDATTAYSYYLKGCNAWGCSPITNSAVIPFQPLTLTSTLAASTATLAWSDKCGNEQGFEIQRKTGDCNAPDAWALLAATETNTKSYNDPSLPAGTYSYHIRSYKQSSALPYAFGYSAYSNCTSLTVP